MDACKNRNGLLVKVFYMPTREYMPFEDVSSFDGQISKD